MDAHQIRIYGYTPQFSQAKAQHSKATKAVPSGGLFIQLRHLPQLILLVPEKIPKSRKPISRK